MKVYEIMEYRNCDEHYSWGLYSSEENARMYLNHMRWNDNDDFEIIEHDVDTKLRYIINEVIKWKELYLMMWKKFIFQSHVLIVDYVGNVKIINHVKQ